MSSTSRRTYSGGRFQSLLVPPWLIISVGVVLAAVTGRFMSDGRTKYGAGIVLAVCFGPLVFTNLPLAFAMWVALQFFAELSQLGYGPNAMSILVGLGWIGAYLGGRASLPALRENRRMAVAITLLILWLTLSIVWATRPGLAFSEAAYWWMAAFAFVITLTTFTTPKFIRQLAVAFVIGAVISVFIGLATGGLNPSSLSSSQTAIQGRLTGGGGDPNQQAAGYVAALFLLVGLFNVFPERRARVLLTAAFAIITVGFFATESRGGLVALAASTVAALVLAPRQRRRIAGLAVVLGVACVGVLASSPGALQRITDVSGGTSGRADLWRVGWEVFTSHPVIGVGAGNFVVIENHYALRPGELTRVQYITETPQIVHNTYLQLLAENGVVGLIAFLAVVTVSLLASWQAVRSFERIGRYDYADLTRAAALGVIGMLCAVFFITDGRDLRLWVLLALGPALLGVARRMTRPTHGAPPSHRRTRRWRMTISTR